MNDSPDFYLAFNSRIEPIKNEIFREGVIEKSTELQNLLSHTKPRELLPIHLQNNVSGNLSMLSPEAFLYFLPSFMSNSLIHFDTLSVFAEELISALEKPEREDIEKSFNQLEKFTNNFTFSRGLSENLKNEQLKWFDTGFPTNIFNERFAEISKEEGNTILKFLNIFQERHGSDFPFKEPKIAIERFWSKFSDC